MRFVFLGTGTSAGIPAIACDCAVCRSPDPRDQRLRSAAAVKFIDERGQERCVLIDASPDLRQQALRFGITRCDAIVFTHNHVDHTFGLDEVRRYNVVQKSAIEVYAEQHTMEHLRRVYQHIFEQERNVNASFVATLAACHAEPGRAIDLFGVSFTPLRLMHGRLPILGYRIERVDGVHGADSPFPLAYCTDVSSIPAATRERMGGLKTLVLDALRHRHHPTHMNLEQAVAAAESIGAERTFFIHMSHDLAHAETEAALPERMKLAYDGLVLG